MSKMMENVFRYLPLNQKDLHWGLYLTGIGRAGISPGSPYPPQGHPEIYDFSWQKGRVLPEYQVVFISDGKGVFESAPTGKVELQTNDAILLFPGQWHRYRPDSKTGWQEHWISFNGDYIWRLQKHSIIQPTNPVIAIQQPQLLLQTHHRIWQQACRTTSQNSFLLSAGALEILAIAVESSPLMMNTSNAAPSVNDTLAAQALALIWTHSYRDISVSYLASELSVTRRTLERRFAEHLKSTVTREIARSRIARAKHLLTHTNLPTEHIALAVGFSGADRLSKVFRQWESMSPLAYRKKQNKK